VRAILDGPRDLGRASRRQAPITGLYDAFAPVVSSLPAVARTHVLSKLLLTLAIRGVLAFRVTDVVRLAASKPSGADAFCGVCVHFPSCEHPVLPASDESHDHRITVVALDTAASRMRPSAEVAFLLAFASCARAILPPFLHQLQHAASGLSPLFTARLHPRNSVAVLRVSPATLSGVLDFADHFLTMPLIAEALCALLNDAQQGQGEVRVCVCVCVCGVCVYNFSLCSHFAELDRV
jgi:hypothetical protein